MSECLLRLALLACLLACVSVKLEQGVVVMHTNREGETNQQVEWVDGSGCVRRSGKGVGEAVYLSNRG